MTDQPQHAADHADQRTDRDLPRPKAPPPCTFATLVDREQERAALSSLVRGTRAGGAAIALLEGPVGSGKSRLLRSLTAEARLNGIRVLEARCDALERDFPFGAVRRLFEPLLASADPQQRARLLSGNARAARQALGSEALHGSMMDLAEDVSFAVLHGLYWFTSHLAEQGPLVIAVDDAHCADLASLRFLVHLARRLEGLPVLLAVSQRTGDRATGAALLDDLAAQPLCRVIRPRPLTHDGIAELVQEVLGRTSDEAFHAACLAATGGNPFLVHALLAALRLHGEPPTVESLERISAHDSSLFAEPMLRVLRQQPPAAMAAARAMAVLGDGSPAESCARLAGLDVATLVPALRTLGSLGLLTGTEDGRTWSFNHGIVREVILADMPSAERAESHRRAARLLLDDGARAEQVAAHLLMTELPATGEWAVTVLREAAREASFRSAPALAVDLLRHCLPDEVDPAADAALLVELGLAEAAVDTHASVRHLQLALEHVHEPLPRFFVLSSLSSGLVRSGQAAQAVRLLAEQTPTVRDATGDLSRLLEGQRLLAAYEDLPSYRDILGESSFGLELPGHTPGERGLLAARAGVVVVRGDRAAEAAAAAGRVLRRGESAADSPFFLASAATVLLYADRPDEADAAYRRIMGSADQDHSTLSYSVCSGLRSEAAYRLGALPEALDATRTALDLAPPGTSGMAQLLPASTRIHVLLEYGDLAGAEAVAAQRFAKAAADTWRWNEYLAARGRLRLAQGEPEAALADLLECGRRQVQWARTSPAVSSWWVWAARAHLALGNGGRARALAEEAVFRARRGDLPYALGAGLSLLAQTETGAKAGAKAGAETGVRRLALLEEALAMLEDSPARLELTRVLIAQGAALHESGRTEAAREVLRRGLESAYALGARVLRAQAHHALLATGARPRRPMSSGLASLTPSEAQVARLAADGRTNQEISEALFVTQRTVEQHLTSVYRKLGSSGRRRLRSLLDGATDSEPA
ncbi:helix-turn-helix transcriptional regulator [Peterkaempfera bronchialis]|uniref:helix-turn-helix transcriptional regulator n=1 Tax=Peterkaempfera bronchialis TaxID=2126346 RepID=UPI0013B38F06|nr:LuxR family transcriptional regulator [Peterkaempfera bronchialis]